MEKTIPTLPWSGAKNGTPKALGEFWHDLLSTGKPAHAVALMLENGVPTGLNPRTRENFINPWLRRVLSEMPLPAEKSHAVLTPDLWSQTLRVLEALPAVLVQANNHPPLMPVPLSKEEGETTLLEVCLHAGWDNLAIHLFSNPAAPAPEVWQEWVSRKGASASGVKGARLPWLHFLASTSRVDVLKFLVGMDKVNINQKDRLQRTPVFYARTLETLEALLEKSPDLGLVGKDGKDVVSTWSALGVETGVLGQMKNRLLAAGNVTFDARQATLETLARDAVVHRTCMDYRNNIPRREYEAQTLDWPDLAGLTATRTLDGVAHMFTASDLFCLGLLEAKSTVEQKALLTTCNHDQQFLWTATLDILHRLLPPVPSGPVDEVAGFPTLLVLFHLLNAGRTIAPLHNYGRSQKGAVVSPEVAGWMAGFEARLGRTPLERLVSMARIMASLHPLFNRTGPVTKMVVEGEWTRRMSDLAPGELAEFWTNPKGLSPASHEEFWERALRPLVTGPLVAQQLLAGGTSLAVAPVSETQSAALYACLTARLATIHEDWSHDVEGKKVQQCLEAMLDAGVPWRATGEDYKWAKSAKLDDIVSLGTRLKVAVEKGRLTKKIGEAIPETTPSPARRRL
jgi:hypothetical protein